eukprot:scaffold31903_cov104-Isochrysis_galbana.AAC.1
MPQRDGLPARRPCGACARRRFSPSWASPPQPHRLRLRPPCASSRAPTTARALSAPTPPPPPAPRDAGAPSCPAAAERQPPPPPPQWTRSGDRLRTACPPAQPQSRPAARGRTGRRPDRRPSRATPPLAGRSARRSGRARGAGRCCEKTRRVGREGGGPTARQTCPRRDRAACCRRSWPRRRGKSIWERGGGGVGRLGEQCTGGEGGSARQGKACGINKAGVGRPPSSTPTAQPLTLVTTLSAGSGRSAQSAFRGAKAPLRTPTRCQMLYPAAASRCSDAG